MFLNFIFGALIGFVANCILAAVLTGGDMINTQMGLSSAMVMDPSTKGQVSVMANYFSGLAYHVYSMLVLSDVYLMQYPFLNKDLVYAGIIIHDIGKIYELSGGKGIEYTKVGNLLGHISIGCNLIYKASCDLGYEDTDECLSLQHIVLAHHGLNEYGSPKEPQMAEAVLIYLLDFSDSRMAALEKEYKDLESLKGGFTNPLPAFERKSFYVPDLKDTDE